MYLRAEVCLCSVKTIAARGTTHSALCIDVHLTRRLRIAHCAVVAGDAVLGMCATVATIDGVIKLHSSSCFRFIVLFHDAK